MSKFELKGDRISLVRAIPSRLPFGKPRIELVRLDEWHVACPGAASAAVARLLQRIEQNEIGRDSTPLAEAVEDGVRCHPDLIARLTESDAEAFGFPQATNLTLNLRVRGLIHRDGFRIDADWARSGGATVNARRSGVWITHNQAQWRIPEPLWSTLAKVDAVNNAVDEAARYAAIAELKRQVLRDDKGQIRLDRILDRLSLQYASGFSLSIKVGPQGISFDPVLFSSDAMTAPDRTGPLDPDEVGLLSKEASTEFAMRFRHGDGSRQSYLLGDGSILYIDPRLADCLRIVRKAQAAAVEERTDFAAAPARYLVQDVNPADGLGSSAFVETSNYSVQLAEVEIWRKQVLPWIKPVEGGWMPASFGLSIGDGADAQWLILSGEQIGSAENAAQRAIMRRSASFELGGLKVPATQAALFAIESLGLLWQEAFLDRRPFPSLELSGRNFLQRVDLGEAPTFAPLAVPDEVTVEASLKPQMPDGLITQPFPHQKEGVHWLIAHWQAHTPGVLLADDVGMGKTWQALAFLAWTRQFARSSLPVLILGPEGFERNWQEQIERHLGDNCVGPVTILGPHELARLEESAGEPFEPLPQAAERPNPGIMLASYACLRDYQMVFARQRFAAIIYDDAHLLRHSGSQLTRAAKSLNARFQLGLTATPVEARFQDIACVLDVLHPGVDTNGVTDAESFTALFQKLGEGQGGSLPTLLRRTISECPELSDRVTMRTVPVEMPPSQAMAYERTVRRALAAKGTDQRARMLQLLRTLDAVCLHPVLPEDAGSDPQYFEHSARFIALFRILDELRAKSDRAVILCDNQALHPLLGAEIRRRYRLSRDVVTIGPRARTDECRSVAAAFEVRAGGFDVLISASDSAGNLEFTSVDHLIVLTRWWDSAVEDRAIASLRSLSRDNKATVYLLQAEYPDPSFRSMSLDAKLHAFVDARRSACVAGLQLKAGLADAEALFNEVIFEPDQDAEDVVQEEIEVPSKSAPAARPGGTLTLVSQPKPTSGSTVRRALPRRVVYRSGGMRDWTIFSAPLQGEEIANMVIIDPYAAAGERARRRTIDFVARLIGEGPRRFSVKLVSYGADGVGTYDDETNREQAEDMYRRWENRFGDLVLSFRPESKSGNRNLHDRSIEVRTVSGRTLIWDLGRGIDGVMTAHHQCTVIFTETETTRKAA